MKSKLYRSTMMLFTCLGIVIWVAGAAAAQEGTMISLNPETLELSPGDTGTLEIRVENVAQLAGAEIHLTFDPALLEIVDANPETEGAQIAHGDFLSPDFVVQNIADPSAGVIDYTIACMPLDKAVSGSGVLARITFHTLAEGETEVAIRSVLLGDTQSQPIAVETKPGAIVVSYSESSLGVWAVIGLASVAVAAGFIVVVWRAIVARSQETAKRARTRT
ncbi:MAG: cohesin domain-containing protein [Chloroflexota bacterium]|nr:cohesin domain-containing protein [Chloroflexota bacterium]